MRKTLKTIVVVAALALMTAVLAGTALAGGFSKPGNNTSGSKSGVLKLSSQSSDFAACHTPWMCS